MQKYVPLSDRKSVQNHSVNCVQVHVCPISKNFGWAECICCPPNVIVWWAAAHPAPYVPAPLTPKGGTSGPTRNNIFINVSSLLNYEQLGSEMTHCWQSAYRGRWICKELNLQGKRVEIARKGIFKERPHNSHPCEFARNGFIQETKEWNLQGAVFARKGISKERGWNLQGMDFARNADYVVSITVP